MVSIMESRDAARELLRGADRAEAAPWVDYPPTPAWFPVSVGAWGAALVLAVSVLDGVWGTVALVALIAGEGAFFAWYRSYRGTWPTGLPPLELRGAALRFVLGAIAVFAGASVLVAVGLPWLGALWVLLTATPLVWWYEGAYAAAAAATRARLG